MDEEEDFNKDVVVEEHNMVFKRFICRDCKDVFDKHIPIEVLANKVIACPHCKSEALTQINSSTYVAQNTKGAKKRKEKKSKRKQQHLSLLAELPVNLTVQRERLLGLRSKLISAIEEIDRVCGFEDAYEDKLLEDKVLEENKLLEENKVIRRKVVK